MLRDLPHSPDPRVLAGYHLADDAGVFRLSDELALVQSVDFFTPVVDDPYTYGQIAATNALSDIYAMGGKPISALNITVFPSKSLSPEVFAQVLRGGAEKALEAGVPIIGGHTVEGDEPIYGLSVTGTIHPDKLVKPSTGKVGDELVLTKPIGTGVIATALKAGRASVEHEGEAIGWMSRLNAKASEAMLAVGAHACTDVTGFGLAGHLSQMAEASGLGAELNLTAIPTLPGAFDYADRGFIPAGANTNREYFANVIAFASSHEEAAEALLTDPQTSGGLLVALDPSIVERFLDLVNAAGETGWRIGRLVADQPGHISVV